MKYHMCISCGRESRRNSLKHGMCAKCNRIEREESDLDDFAFDIDTTAEAHDMRYHGGEVQDVEWNDTGLD